MVSTGDRGGSPEIYEKIDPVSGKGCVVIFANAKGEYEYISTNKVAKENWQNEDVDIRLDKKGRAVIRARFNEPSAKIIFFGVR